MKLPKLCRNKTRDRAFVLERGKRIYLGKWGAPETEAAYKLYIHNLTTGLPTTPPTGSGSVTLMELAAAFMKARANYYVKNGRQTHQLERFKQALEFPLRYYGAVCMDEFGPRKLLECRALMEESGRFSRKYINVLIVCFRGVVKFGVENELVKPETLVALQAISPLKRGRSCARDHPPVAAGSVPFTVVRATPSFYVEAESALDANAVILNVEAIFPVPTAVSRWVFDWGDGTTTELDRLGLTACVAHCYASSHKSRTVSLSVVLDDGKGISVSFDVRTLRQ